MRPEHERNAEIVRYIEKGAQQKDLAGHYGVTASRISAIWRDYLASLDESLPTTYWRRLGLSSRAAACLVNEGIYSLKALRGSSLRELARVPNVGALTMVEYFELLTKETKP